LIKKIIIKEENFKWHLEAFASELFMLFLSYTYEERGRESYFLSL